MTFLSATKGYLGPLGDDFPAIFPISMGLLLFFSAITLTYNYYNLKHDSALLMEANTALAKAARSQLVFDSEYWDKTCSLVDKTKANYGVRAKLELLRFEDGVFDPLGGIGSDSIENPCVDYLDENNNPLPDPTTFSMALTYPVIINDGGVQKIATLRVTTWK